MSVKKNWQREKEIIASQNQLYPRIVFAGFGVFIAEQQLYKTNKEKEEDFQESRRSVTRFGHFGNVLWVSKIPTYLAIS